MEQHAEPEGGFEALYKEMASVSKSLPLTHFFSHHLTGKNCTRLQFFYSSVDICFVWNVCLCLSLLCSDIMAQTLNMT